MKLKTLNKILIAVAAFIALVILGVTIAFFIESGGIPEAAYRRADPAPQQVIVESGNAGESVDAFTGIGRLRMFAKSAAGDGSGSRASSDGEDVVSVIVITPWFSYPAGNRALFEELSQKIMHIRSIFTDYFLSMTLDEIKAKGELRIKDELLEEINDSLVMGQIRAVYFSEYLFIE